MADMTRAVVLLSGSGRTLENLLTRSLAGKLPLDIRAVVSSRAKVRGIAVAREHGLPVSVFRRRDYLDIEAHNSAINTWLQQFSAEIIILAGYLCYYRKPEGFTGSVVNIHPALLPRYGGQGYYGDRVHQAVLAAGDKESGCTVHLVDDIYDNGRILGQQRVPVLPDDSVADLAARVFAAECELYPAVLARLVAEKG